MCAAGASRSGRPTQKKQLSRAHLTFAQVLSHAPLGWAKKKPGGVPLQNIEHDAFEMCTNKLALPTWIQFLSKPTAAKEEWEAS